MPPKLVWVAFARTARLPRQAQRAHHAVVRPGCSGGLPCGAARAPEGRWWARPPEASLVFEWERLSGPRRFAVGTGCDADPEATGRSEAPPRNRASYTPGQEWF